MNQEHFDKALELIEDRDVGLHTSGHAEPGYTNPKSGMIATGNWNDVSRWDEATNQRVVIDDSMPKLAEQLEELGVELEWSDEWTECTGCMGLVRTSPDSYRWRPGFMTSDDGLFCVECVKKDPAPFLKELEGDGRNAVTIDLDFEACGYRLLDDDLENGLYGGQSADPKKIAAHLKSHGVERFFFALDRNGQFDCEFSVWVHESEFGAAQEAYETADVNGPDPAVQMKKALRGVTAVEQSLSGEGVKVITLHNDGTATGRVVSQQDFIEGKALE